MSLRLRYHEYDKNYHKSSYGFQKMKTACKHNETMRLSWIWMKNIV